MKFQPRFSSNRDSGANLKKVLALVLAFACAFTMFAGAAFTDSADIKVDTEVVDTLVSLGVVNGYDDGSFKPNGTVTRAEMAKMIYVLRTGNSDASAYNDDKTSFTDIGSHWARGYIKYCQSLGIIAGKSNTKFCPNDKVTAQEAAKMLLVTLGYNAEKAGLTGASWASKTNALADENGLLEDVNTSFTTACPRQYAAQLIYNAIFAKTVVLRDGEYTDETAMGVANKTVGEKYMGMKEAVGELTTISYDSDKDEYSYTVVTGYKTVTDAHNQTTTTPITETYKSSKDYSKLYGLNVKVLYKTSNNKTTVYGLYAKDSSIVASGKLGDLKVVNSDTQKIKIDNTEYKLSVATTAVPMVEAISGNDFNSGNPGTKIGATKLVSGSALNTAIRGKEYYNFDLLDTDDDDKGDKIVVYPVVVGEVTYAGTKSINVDGVVGTLKYEDEDIAEGIKKDDYAVVTLKANNAKDCVNVVKAEIVSGKVTATKSGSIQINGTWYDLPTGSSLSFSVGDSYDVAVYNGYAFSADMTDEASKDILFVAGTKPFDQFAGENNGTVDAKVYFLDGSNKTVTITKVDVVKLNATSGTAANLVGKLYTYFVKDGNYELKVMNATNNKAGYKEYASPATYTASSEKIGDYAIASDAVVFVKDQTETKIVTGKSVKDWNTNFGTTGEVLVSEINGIKYAKVAALVDASNTRPSASGDYKYAYLTDDTVAGQTKDEDEDNALVFTAFGENGAATLYDTEDYGTLTVSTLAKGQLIQYREDGSKIKDVKVIGTTATATTTTDIKRVAITGVEDKNKGLVYFLDSSTDAAVSPNTGKSTSLKLDEDAYFVKIDDANNSAEAGKRADVVNAHSETSGKSSANAYIAVDGGKIVAVYYDVDKLDDGVEFVDHN